MSTQNNGGPAPEITQEAARAMLAALRFYACDCKREGEDCGDNVDAHYCGLRARCAIALAEPRDPTP